MLHSINIDPRDPQHLDVGLSSGGVFESTDGGRDWHPLNGGCEHPMSPDVPPEFGHDPHSVRIHPARPDRLYQHELEVGVYFGTTSGEIWASANEGSSWRCIASHLPEIYSVEFADAEPGLRS